MSILLRGKKTALKNYTENFTKVPNIILHANGLSPVDKLILIELQSYATRPEYVLAYTRLAQDLKIDKSNLIARWKTLQEKGYIIITSNDRWSINYNLLESQVGSPLLKSQVGLTHQPTKQGSVTPPIEEDNKEEEKEKKNKEEKAPIEDFKTSQSKESINKNKVINPIDRFLSDFSTERINKLASKTHSELYQTFLNIEDDSIDLNELIRVIKKRSSIKKNIQSVSPLDFDSRESISMGDKSQSTQVLAAKGGIWKT